MSRLSNLNGAPFLSVPEIPLRALLRVNPGRDGKQYIIIKESYFDACILAKLLQAIGYSDVKLYQNARDQLLGLKVTDKNGIHKGVVAPIKICDNVTERVGAKEVEFKTSIPTLQDVIYYYKSGRSSYEQIFSLINYRKAKQQEIASNPKVKAPQITTKR